MPKRKRTFKEQNIRRSYYNIDHIMKVRSDVKNIEFDGRLYGKEIKDKLFRNCIFDNVLFDSCKFENITFYNCIFSYGVIYNPRLRFPVIFRNCILNSLLMDIYPTLENCKLIGYSCIPETGSFIAYKLVKTIHGRPLIAELEIPADAKRTWCLESRKCRVSKSKVIRFFTPSGKVSKHTQAYSTIRNSTLYRVGEIVTPDKYIGKIEVECTHGIHIFPTFDEAINFAGSLIKNQDKYDIFKVRNTNRDLRR